MEVQMDIATGLTGVTWLVIVALLLWGFVDGLRRALNDRTPLPFFVMLERRGLTATQVEAAAGIGGVAHALRRCAYCAGRSDCGRRAVDCPNEALIRHVTRLAQA
jgi:hypothetical protein